MIDIQDDPEFSRALAQVFQTLTPEMKDTVRRAIDEGKERTDLPADVLYQVREVMRG